MKPTVNRISTPSVKMSDSESKIIIMTESNVGSQAFWIIITGETNESLGSVYEIMINCFPVNLTSILNWFTINISPYE